jgi:mevalonate kinase
MIKVSAPGSMLMFGEHSVLRGGQSIVLAIDKHIDVSLEPRTDKLININSCLGTFKTSIENIDVQPPFQYVLQALKNSPPSFGLNISTVSEMSSTMGLGTSAAVVVAVIAGLITLEKNDMNQLFSRALQVVRQIQGIGSGADVMASIKGGVGLFQDSKYQSLSLTIELFASYFGKKIPTAEVVKYVAERFSNYAELLQNLDTTNNAITKEASKHLNNPQQLGEILNISSGLMEAFGVHTKEIEDFLWSLREQSFGVKLSGSGLGDCAIGVVKNGFYPEGSFPITVATKGLKIEK